MIKGLIAGLVVVVFMLVVLSIETWRGAKRMENAELERLNAALIMFLAIIVAVLVMAISTTAKARDLGQWENTDPAIREWYRTLKQPDHPWVPCCGEADAYFADEVHVRDGKTYATITDDRADEPLMRHHVPIGTEIFIPDYKLKYDAGNPTGHAVVFLNINNEAWCFVQGSGI